MSNCSVLVVWALLAAVVATVVGLKIDGDPVIVVSKKADRSKASPRVLIQVWSEDDENLQADIVTNKIPQRNKTQTLRRKLIPNYDFPVVPVVTGKSAPSSQPVLHILCRRPYRPAWSWKLWFRGQTHGQQDRVLFEVDDKLGSLSEDRGGGKKKPEISDKMGEGIEEKEEDAEDEEGVVEEEVNESPYLSKTKQDVVKEMLEGVVDEETT